MAETLDLVEFLSHLRARWLVWLIAALAGAAIGGGISLLRPARYLAETHLLVEPPPDASGTYVLMSPSYLDSLRTYEALAEGKTVRARAMASLTDAQRATAGEIEADVPELSRVIAVRAEASDPETALALARAAAEQTLGLVKAARAKDPQERWQVERLALIDPGELPQTPEDRNTAMNALAAAFFALAAAGVYESSRILLHQPNQDG